MENGMSYDEALEKLGEVLETMITGPNVRLKEWARIVDVKLSFAYELSRHNRIEGMFRVGKFIRVNLPAFFAAKGIEPWNDTAEELTE